MRENLKAITPSKFEWEREALEFIHHFRQLRNNWV